MAPNQIPNTLSTNEHILDAEPPQTDMTIEQNLTTLQKFYKDANIFITGGTGFLGKILIEKLLRSASDVQCLYILVRSKKGKNMHSRIQDIFDDPVFDRLRKEQPKFQHKVQGISGDCSLPNCGISKSDIEMLQSKISIVFHVAATVRFDEKLKLACAINVVAPRDLVHIAKGMTELKSFMHVSTAYANCHLKEIDEKIYDPPMDSEKLITLTQCAPESLLDSVTPTILGDWPNTYAYTKAIAEDVIKQNAVDLPCGIFRPGIVLSTFKEPIEGWIDNMYGPTGVAAGAANGLIRTIHCKPDNVANIIPVDMCVNSLIAAAWEVCDNHEKILKEKREKTADDIIVYNYVSTEENPIKWGQFMNLNEFYGFSYPSSKAVYYYAFTMNPNLLIHWMYVILLHYLPAIIIDGASLLMGKRPRMLKVFQKINRFLFVISYFTTREWKFNNQNVQNLNKKLSKEDQELFLFDMKKLNWNTFFETYILGIRIYLVKDPITTLEAAKKRWTRLYYLHNGIKILSLLVLLRICWYIVSILYS
ncbi:fatty acyl-CoA reductase wat-like [Chrysoperla carnea]|uniref:fatty acyl-CoA reductase wat-like n=1 Tax=Chrysoperla carnea TaxID=189513 RepID=UPI001D073E89|nr:fatty acyl-CoA reductase wat-like [Chrysoperla carnea]XP_044735343.1 fatty acyl-CoA reductase wat-like [Chrysoperla carnea]